MKIRKMWIIGLLFGIMLLGYGLIHTHAEIASDTDDSSPTTEHSDIVTLITGDKVEVNETKDGTQTLDIKPMDRDGYEPSFEQINDDDNLYVIPKDIAEFIPEKVDRELFNVNRLIDEGYSDEVMKEIPIIMTFNDSKALNNLENHSQMLTSLSDYSTLSSVQGIAAKIEKDNLVPFNQSLFNQQGARLQSTTVFQDSVDQIRLDRKVEINLEDSVPQIGAPDAWESGYDGKGVNVAVLDTGIDSEHLDLEGKVTMEKNFSDDEAEQDGHGHGTHVASIIAGNGTASDGEREGVAPGASLINAKVMGEDGTGKESDIIQGMEWAANQEVDLINMSLGTKSPTDGTDPLSEAVNQITKEKDVLFVTSSGNEGPNDASVTGPGSADSALTVGSVDKSDSLSPTSSRGPRLKDDAIKPDVTAPGVDINAARAQDTSMGAPIDDYYTTASGTSMAAPHVAGAAALLIEKLEDTDNDWDSKKLKSDIVSSASPNEDNTVFEQGGGRIDVSRMIDQDIFSSPQSLSFGSFQNDSDDLEPVQKEITYENESNESINLNISFQIESEEGEQLPENTITLSQEELTLGSGEKKTIDATLDPEMADLGQYGGYVTAKSSDDEEILHTPVSFHKKEKMYDLTIKGIERDGDKAGRLSDVDVIDVYDKQNIDATRQKFHEGETTVEVPEGKYSVIASIQTMENNFSTDISLLGEPEIKVDKDMEVTLDARDAVKISVDTEDETEKDQFSLGYSRIMEEWGSYSTSTYASGVDAYAVPTEKVNTGEFIFMADWELTSPENISGKPYFYKLTFMDPLIPSNLNYEVQKSDLAEVDAKYYTPNQDGKYKTSLYTYAGHFAPSSFEKDIDIPMKRTEYYSSNEDVSYQRRVLSESGELDFRQPKLSYEKDRNYETSWLKQPIHSGIQDDEPAYREDEKIVLDMPTYLDAHNHYASDSGVSKLKLFKNDELISEESKTKGDFPVGSDDADFNMELTTKTDEDFSPLSNRIHTNWSFHSKEPEEGHQENVPLLTLDYNFDLQLDNTASLPEVAGGSIPMSFTVQHQPGAKDIPIDDVHLWLSHNDGEEWNEIENLQSDGDGEFSADVEDLKDNRDGNGYVSLKVEAEDEDGNSVEQEIIRAYEWNFEGDINGDDMIDIHDVMRAVAFFGTENEQADINGDGIVDEKDMRILEKNFLKVGPDADENAEPVEKLGNKGIDDLLRSVGMEPEN